MTDPESNEPDGPDEGAPRPAKESAELHSDETVDATLNERYFAFVERVHSMQALGETISVDALAHSLDLEPGRVEEWLKRLRDTDEALPAAPFTLGDRFAPPELPDDYELLGELGRGGMGIVYRVHQSSLDRTLALKVLRPGDLTFGETLDRFQREARSLARLKHPHIVPVYEVGQTGSHLYFTMDYIEGESLSTRLSRGALTPALARKLVSEVASAIAHAHDRGIIHRDLKPANILIDTEDRASVVDFGLAMDIGTVEQATVTGRLLGTPMYMSPEQARGDRERIGERSDIYALGAVLYQCLTGRQPFPHKNFGDLIHAVLQEEPKKLRTVAPQVPRDLERICEKAMAKNPDDRYATMEAFRNDLELYAEGKPILARPPRLIDRATRWVSRHRTPVIAGSLVTVILVVAMIFSFLFMSRLAPQRLLEEAAQLRLDGNEKAAERLEEIAEQLTVVAAPGEKSLESPAQQAKLDELEQQVRDVALAVSVEEAGVEERRKEAERAIHDWGGQVFGDPFHPSRFWLLDRLRFAKERWKEDIISMSQEDRPSFRKRWIRWASMVLRDPDDPERPAVIGMGIEGLPLLREEPELYRQIVLGYVDDLTEVPWRTRGSISARFPRHDVGPLIDDLIEVIGRNSSSEVQRAGAAKILCSIARLPLGLSNHREPPVPAEVVDLVSRLRDAGWKEGWEQRIAFAREKVSRPTDQWLRNLGLRGFSGKPHEVWDWLAAKHGVPAGSEDLLPLLRQHRASPDSSLRFLISERIITSGVLPPPPTCRSFEIDELPWDLLDGEDPVWVRVASFFVSNPEGIPELESSDALLLGPNEGKTVALPINVRGKFVGSWRAPGLGTFPLDPPRSYVNVTLSRGLQQGRRVLLSGGTLVVGFGGSSMTGGGRAILAESIGSALYRPEQPTAPGHLQHLVLFAEDRAASVVDGVPPRPWSREEWQVHLGKVLTRLTEEQGRNHDQSLTHSLQDALSLAGYFPLPQVADDLRALHEGESGGSIQELCVLARLLADDGEAVEDFQWKLSDLTEAFGFMARFDTAYCARLLAHTEDSRIQALAMDALRLRPYTRATADLLRRVRDESTDPQLVEQLDGVLKRAPGRWSPAEVRWLVAVIAVWLICIFFLLAGPGFDPVRTWALILGGLFCHSFRGFYEGVPLTHPIAAILLMWIGVHRLRALAPKEKASSRWIQAAWHGLWFALACTVIQVVGVDEPVVASSLRLLASTAVGLSFAAASIGHFYQGVDFHFRKSIAPLVYAGLILFAFANWLWAWAAWGDPNPSWSVYRSLFEPTILAVGVVVLSHFIELLDRTPSPLPFHGNPRRPSSKPPL